MRSSGEWENWRNCKEVYGVGYRHSRAGLYGAHDPTRRISSGYISRQTPAYRRYKKPKETPVLLHGTHPRVLSITPFLTSSIIATFYLRGSVNLTSALQKDSGFSGDLHHRSLGTPSPIISSPFPFFVTCPPTNCPHPPGDLPPHFGETSTQCIPCGAQRREVNAKRGRKISVTPRSSERRALI